MRVCALHRERAVETLRSNEGLEYDLCKQCRDMVAEILDGKETESGTGRTAAKTRINKNKTA